MKTPKKPLPLSKVYTHIEPGPLVLVTTIGPKGPNIMAMSWHMMIEFEPPLMGIILSDRNYSFSNLKKRKECVINIPTVALKKEVVGCGNTSGRRVNKFKRFGLTALPSQKVTPPLIAECYANFECEVVNTTLTNQYNLFIIQVVQAWIHRDTKTVRTLHHTGKGTFFESGRRFSVRSKMK